ncbi:MAG: hypothetical protein FJ317_07150, partial [SAR202 cluster bacterium]|nr:hypothetical protein [SAR202 cluster bacterium]
MVQERNSPGAAGVEMVTESTMLGLLLRAFLFDRSVYRELMDRPLASFAGLGIVVLVGIAFATGLAGKDTLDLGGSRVLTAIWRANFIVFGWVLWSWESILIGRYALGGVANVQQMLRSLGFALSPGILFFFASIPIAGDYFFIAVLIWILVTGSMAVKETLGFNWWKGIVTGAFGWLLVYPIMLNV